MSAKPPAFALHKSPILWEQSWQKYLDELYVKNPTSIEKLVVLKSTPDSAIREAFKLSHGTLCELQRRLFNFAAERCVEDDFDRKWRAAGPEAQEKCYFAAMKRIGRKTHGSRTRRSPLVIFGRTMGGAILTSCDRSSLLTNTSASRTPFSMLHLGLKAHLTPAIRFPQSGIASCTKRRHGDFTFLPEAPAQNSSDSAQEANKKGKQVVVNQVKSICGNCKKRASDFPDRTFKSCTKCRGTPSSVMYCSRECQVNDWKNGDPPHKTVCGTTKPRSAALLKQIAMLEKHPSADYFYSLVCSMPYSTLLRPDVLVALL